MATCLRTCAYHNFSCLHQYFLCKLLKSHSHTRGSVSVFGLCNGETSSWWWWRSRGRCHHDVAQNPKQQFREKFLPVFVKWEILFFSFFFVVFAMRPNRFAHIRGTADTVAIMGIEYGWPPSCHLATFCLFFVCASFGLLCKCVCVSIYNTRSFTLSDSLGVYSYPLSFGSQTRLRLQLELKSVQCGRQSGGMEKRGWGVATWRSYASCCMHFVCW